MGLRLIFIYIFTLVRACTHAEIPSATLFTVDEWVSIAPHLLPDTHPVKPILDRIFSKERAIRTADTMKKAGFHILTEGHWSDTVIATHSKAEGYFFKLFTEDQAHIDEVTRLLARIRGALYAQEIVNKHQWNKLFKVPRKWFYILPEDKEPIEGIPSKRVILVAEDMRLLEKEASYAKWRSASFDKKLFKAVFQILTEGGFSDSSYAFNLPFAKDGRIALIDNDKHNKRPIPFHNLFRYLHPNLKAYAEKLMKENPGLAY